MDKVLPITITILEIVTLIDAWSDLDSVETDLGARTQWPLEELQLCLLLAYFFFFDSAKLGRYERSLQPAIPFEKSVWVWFPSHLQLFPPVLDIPNQSQWGGLHAMAHTEAFKMAAELLIMSWINKLLLHNWRSPAFLLYCMIVDVFLYLRGMLYVYPIPHSGAVFSTSVGVTHCRLKLVPDGPD